ncbi:type II secretion system F family protein [Herbiconiux sp. YIM B11900]|uniref:type II secretion system F family protein n=1 Tax=Herbiconiux sp. YIM B11900 TaxID=3404131 RepID=UPI003F871C9F
MLAASWFVATEAGASLSRCLVDIAEALRDLGAVEREVAVALSGPRATTRLVLALPFVSLGAGMLWGLNTVQVLVATPPGWICLGAGAVLVLLGRAWSRWLLRRGSRRDLAPGLALDLVAVAVAGGGSADGAVELVAEALRRYSPVCSSGTMARASGNDGRERRQIEAVLSLAALAGAPPAQLLRAEAVRMRRDAIGAASERAASLGVQLMLPLGLCVLPAFLLLSVAPVLLGVLRSTSFVSAG